MSLLLLGLYSCTSGSDMQKHVKRGLHSLSLDHYFITCCAMTLKCLSLSHPAGTAEGVGPHFKVTTSRIGNRQAATKAYAPCGPNSRMAVSCGPYIDNDVYDARMLSRGSLHVSWSPACVCEKGVAVATQTEQHAQDRYARWVPALNISSRLQNQYV
jgi:hypothetical protein